MDGNRDSGHAERVRQLRDANPDPSGDYFIIDRAAFNQGENAKFDMQITRGGGTAQHWSLEDRAQWSHLWTKVGALCATDYKWVQEQQVEQGKIIPVLR